MKKTLILCVILFIFVLPFILAYECEDKGGECGHPGGIKKGFIQVNYTCSEVYSQSICWIENPIKC